MAGFSKKERQQAAGLHADSERRIADIERRTVTATTPKEHTQLGRERARAFGDRGHATFILTDDGKP